MPPEIVLEKPKEQQTDEIVVLDQELAQLAEWEKDIYGDTKDLEAAVEKDLGKHIQKGKIKEEAAAGEEEGEEKPKAPKEKAGDKSKFSPPEKKDGKKPAKEGEEEAAEDEEEKPKPAAKKALPFQKKKDAPAEGQKYENLDEIATGLSKLGFTKSDKVDAGTFLHNFVTEVAPKLRQATTRADQAEERFNKITEILDNAPAPLQKALIAYANQGDYEAAYQDASKGFLDFRKPFDKQMITVAKNLMPELNVTDPDEDDYTDLTADDKKTQKLVSSLQRLFNEKKTAWDEQKIESTEKEKVRGAKASDTIKESLDSLKDSLPEDYEASASQLKEIRKVLATGDINSIFYDKEGIPLPDVAKRLYFAMFGETVISEYENEISRVNGEGTDILVTGRGKSAATSTNKRTVATGVKDDLVSKYEKPQKGQSKFSPPTPR